MKKRKSSAAGGEQESDALKNFEVNLDDISAFITRIGMGPTVTLRAARKALRLVEEARQRLVGKETNAPDIKRLLRSVATVHRSMKQWLAFNVPATRWVAVMLVSYLEGYLEDVLVGIAFKNSRVIKKVDVQTARLFEVDSIEELKAELRRNWAHDELRPNGPSTWRRTLRDLGAPVVADTTIDKMQHLWDTRNLIVHARCIADAAYAKKYANRGAKVDVEVRVNLHSLEEWLEAVKEFVKWVDAFYLKYGTRPS